MRPWTDTRTQTHVTTIHFVLSTSHAKCNEHAFSHADLAAWNAVSEGLHAVIDSAKFRKQSKTHNFTLAFNVL